MSFPVVEPLKEPLIFDSHCHYDDERFEDLGEALLAKLPEYGVCGVVTCGCDGESSRKALALAEKYDHFYAAVGIHPGNVNTYFDVEEIEKMSHHKKCVAIGEIGLDYYWESDNRLFQQEIFEKQLEMAKRVDKPVLIHDRDAHADTLEILKKHKPKGVVHCFSGSPEMAAEILKLGLYIGVGGVVTFKNAKRLPEVLEMLPDDRLLLETDCPYLAPEPFRGKLCHSGLIALTAQKIAEIRGTSRDEILKISRKNAKNLFGL